MRIRTVATTLAIGRIDQPEEAVPRDDQVAMRYLLVTADEDRLLKVANPWVASLRLRYRKGRVFSRGKERAAATVVIVSAHFLPLAA